MDSSVLFADRIGGPQFGKVQKTFKFTLIDNAKRDFMRRNPAVAVIDLGVGEPEERAPDFVIDALYTAAKVPANRIYPNNGGPEFRAAAARYLKRLLGESFDQDNELVHCIGTKSALAQIPLAFLNPGDHVVTTTPGYPVLPTIAGWYGASVHALPLQRSKRFLPDLNELETLARTHRPKIVLLNYPNNPTGAVASRSFYEAVVALAHRYEFLIVQDAAYADLVYGTPYVSPLQIAGGREVTLELYSLSKSYNMQGYRLGFVVGGAALVKAYALVKDNTDNGQFLATQSAGATALDAGAPFLEQQRSKYRRRLERVSQIFSGVGLEAHPAPGGFYLYLAAPAQFQGQRFDTAQGVSTYLIEKHGIVTVPWEEAGPHLRLSMTFEVGTAQFPDEESVYVALQERLS